MFGWFIVGAMGALGITAHVRSVSADEARRAAIRASLNSPRGQTLIAAVSNVGAFILPTRGGT